MSRLEKKCLLASTVMHSFLLLLVVFGAAFFTPRQKEPPVPRLRFFPTKLVDDALAGGGGNPTLPHTDDVQKGETLTPQPPTAVATPPKPPQPPAPQPPQPKPVVKPAEAVRVTPKPAGKPAPTKPVEIAKPNPNATKPKETTIKDLLTPKIRNNEDKAKAKAEAEAREASRAEAAYRTKMANALDKTLSGLREGFTSSTTVDIDGPGGAAFADYRQFVQAIYQETWERTLPQEILAEDTASSVSVTISRSGKVLDSHILRSSGNSSIDRYVKRTLEKVTFVHEFPQTSHDEQRTFTIEFIFRNRRGTG